MGKDLDRRVVIERLKNAGIDDERAKEFLQVVPAKEAYENLRRNEILKKVIAEIGLEEVEKRAERMGVTIDEFAKEFDRWNDCDSVKIVYRATKEESEELTEEMWKTMISNWERLDKEIKSKNDK